MASSSAQDIRYLTEALPQLQDYLLSEPLYTPLGGGLPQLSLGFLSLTLRRVDALQPEAAASFHQQVDTVCAQWRSAWEKKAAREAAGRLRLWSAFLSDYRAAADKGMDWYRTEARGRAILQILLDDLPDMPDKTLLAGLDASLKARFVPGDFLWEAALRSAFPPQAFWFLYGRPKG